jgi:hypothetical protein
MKTLALLLAGALALASLPAAAHGPFHPHATVELGFGFPYHYYGAYPYDPWLYPYAVAPYVVPGPADDRPAAGLYAYPQRGQTAEQVSRDRAECHEWAAGQSDFDPLTAKREKTADLANYDRAFTACMEARNYSVG